MYVVGSDRLAVSGGQAVPAGTWHAVTLDGAIACDGRTPAYQFPAIAWEEDTDEACVLCRATVAAGSTSVPDQSAYPAEVPAQEIPVV